MMSHFSKHGKLLCSRSWHPEAQRECDKSNAWLTCHDCWVRLGHSKETGTKPHFIRASRRRGMARLQSNLACGRHGLHRNLSNALPVLKVQSHWRVLLEIVGYFLAGFRPAPSSPPSPSYAPGGARPDGFPFAEGHASRLACLS